MTALVAAALVVGGVLLVGGAGAAGARTARIGITGTTVKTVHGTGFRPHERVRITMRSTPGMTRVRHATTNAQGRFRATFAHFRMSGCGTVFSVIVIGSKGSRARLAHHLVPMLMCAN
jgi:hypothetical protein